MSKEDYIARNQNIYEGIDSSNIKISISDIAKNENEYQISYRQQMYTSAGEVDFYNVAHIVKENGEYKLKWTSGTIFPQLEETDKVRVETIKAKRGSILDRNGNQKRNICHEQYRRPEMSARQSPGICLHRTQQRRKIVPHQHADTPKGARPHLAETGKNGLDQPLFHQ